MGSVALTMAEKRRPTDIVHPGVLENTCVLRKATTPTFMAEK